MVQDYYKILDVSRDASEDEVKKAYKRRALQFHPDVNSNDNAQDIFKSVNLAYQTLINPERRKKYDWLLKYGITEYVDVPKESRYRHPADARYYYRRQAGNSIHHQKNKSQTKWTQYAIEVIYFYLLLIAFIIISVFLILDYISKFT